jgi:hypothetical protein
MDFISLQHHIENMSAQIQEMEQAKQFIFIEGKSVLRSMANVAFAFTEN